MKRNLLFIIALFVCTLSFSQGELDAYRYSNNDLSGTARGQAMGGAFGALGGDVTGVAINPAGIGIYRSSEVLANMSLTSSLKQGNSIQESNTKFHFDNLSYIGYYPLVKGSMLSLNFGFNYNRIKSFDQRYNASSAEKSSSLTDYFLEITDGIYHTTLDNYPYNNSSVPWLSILAWDGYLINKGNSDDNYMSILYEGEQVNSRLKVSERGRVESYDFTIGSNIADKFYWGVTLAITDLSYYMYSYYDEAFSEGDGFLLENHLETKGSGIQAKLGMIYKPSNAIRLGIAYHSPVWYSMTDYFWAQITPDGIYDGKDELVGTKKTPKDSYSYNFRTPGSWTFSLAGILGTKAIVSVDYEIKDYSAMNLKDTNGNDFIKDNKKINNDYKNASTLRTGLEYKFTPQLSGRLGYAWSQNPYQSDIELMGKNTVSAGTITHYALQGDVNYLTAGIGFRFTPQFYGDFALVLRTQKDYLYYYPEVHYITNVESDSFAGDFTNKSLKGLVTLGYKF